MLPSELKSPHTTIPAFRYPDSVRSASSSPTTATTAPSASRLFLPLDRCARSRSSAFVHLRICSSPSLTWRNLRSGAAPPDR